MPAVPATTLAEALVSAVIQNRPGAVSSAGEGSQPQLLLLSAPTQGALEQAGAELREFLAANVVDMADVAAALQRRAQDLPYRRFLVCRGREDALAVLAEAKPQRAPSGQVAAAAHTTVFLLPGIGDHYVGMGDGLYQGCQTFREEVDRCAGILEPLLGVDIRQVIWPASESWKQTLQAKGIDLKRMLGRSADEAPDPDTLRLSTTLYSQPALFTIEYAMARQWAALGVTPGAMIGHSMGEYVAACLAGVLSLADALRLIAVRAKLVNELPQAPMLAVMLPEAELLPQLPADLSVSLINGPSHCVVAGPPDSISALERTLTERGVIARRVQNGHAFHTRLMEPVVGAFEEEVRKVSLSAPQIPYISNVTGTWITAADATDPTYWARHLTHTARFSEALHQMWQLPDPVMLECGPGRTLTILANQHPERKGPLRGAISSIRQRYENETDIQVLFAASGRAWLAGTAINWQGLPRDNISFASPPSSVWSAPPPAAVSGATAAPAAANESAIAPAADEAGVAKREQELLAIWSRALGREDIGVNDSFGALGGDSLSSIAALLEMKRVGVPERVCRGLYRGLTIRQMVREEAEGGGSSHQATAVNGIPVDTIEMPVFLRALGIYLVIASHYGITYFEGNPVLMVVSGLSFAKFQLRTIEKERSVLPVVRFSWKIALPAIIDTLARQIAHHSFHPLSFILIDNLLEPHPFGAHQSPYYIDLLIQSLLIAAVPLAVPAIRRFAVARPLAYGIIALLCYWLLSILAPYFFDPTHAFYLVPQCYLWLLALGWCAAFSSTRRDKLLLTGAFLGLNLISYVVGGRLGWNGWPGRGVHEYVAVTTLALIWLDEVPAKIPTVLVHAINAVAAASLFIYLTHIAFKDVAEGIWNHLAPSGWPSLPLWIAVAIAMVGGYYVWQLWEYGLRSIPVWLGRRARPAEPAPATGSW
jgi:malonyl CoA-acyl carrier protein transacylase/peptidoglycan/LPS O-acetylase OafA/YrhL